MLFFFFFNDTATTEIYTLSLHDALPISDVVAHQSGCSVCRSASALKKLNVGGNYLITIELDGNVCEDSVAEGKREKCRSFYTDYAGALLPYNVALVKALKGDGDVPEGVGYQNLIQMPPQTPVPELKENTP